MSTAVRAHKAQNPFFAQSLAESDPEVFGSVGRELVRQQTEIELISS